MSRKIGDLVSVALERTYAGDKGFVFENFCQDLGRCEYGEDFFATSPFKDEGIDGFLLRVDEDLIVTRQSKPETIFQFGTTEGFENKIRSTFNDLKNRNIHIKKITYYSPRRISMLTSKVQRLEDELDISIKVIDHSQLTTMASNQECKHIFNDLITTMLGAIDSKDEENITLDYPVLYLSTWYRYEKNTEQLNTISNMTDNLIVWALRSTDPDKKIFMTEKEIYNAIEEKFPTAKNHIKSIFSGRLKKLLLQRTLNNKQQMIQKHKGHNYCLPLESREEYNGKYEESSELLLLTKASFSQRLINVGFKVSRSNELSELILHTIKHVFQERGLRFAQTLIDNTMQEYDEIYLRDAVAKASNDLTKYYFKDRELEQSAIVLRKVFAIPNKHVYLMHYIMHNDIGITTYFKERTKKLKLIIHSDILIRALSEQYLPKEGQHYRNMLNYLLTMEAELLVTEESLIEIYKNLQIASYEYRNHLQIHERHFTVESIKFLPVLMTRAYLYSLRNDKVKSWDEFIDNFCTPKYLYSNTNQSKVKEDLKMYITDKFKLKIIRSHEIENNIDLKLSEELTQNLKRYKKREEIAKHVANVNLYVLAIRDKNNEITNSPYGYRTYWLTHEKTAYSSSKDFFDKYNLGTKIIMRPEFIMQEIQLTPDMNNINKSYTATFPTALGIQMSQHLNVKTFHPLMKKFKELDMKDSSRNKSLLNEIIQVASEKTELVHDLDVYDTTYIDEYNNSLPLNSIEGILKEAQDRDNKKRKNQVQVR